MEVIDAEIANIGAFNCDERDAPESAEIINFARTWINTPFHPQGRLKNVGCDCIGLLLGLAREMGAVSAHSGQSLFLYDVREYHYLRDGPLLKVCIEKHLKKVQRQIVAGDILFFQFTRHQLHLAIVSEVLNPSCIRIIHSCLSARKVVEHIMDISWFDKIIGRFVFISSG